MYIDLRPGQTCHSKVMHRKEVTHSDGSYEKKSHRRALLTIWDKVKSHGTLIDWCTGREWPANCMTVIFACWRSNMPFQRLIELLYNSMETESQWVGDQISWRQVVVEKAITRQKETHWWQDAVEKARTQQSVSPGLRLSIPGERERYNADGHKSGGQYIAVLFGLQFPLTYKPFK